ncbi:hypothetical protein ABZ446_34370 [Streptomyces sp. NPDC005813]|uniref:hypothetical protein n=1 Tax=Streptomyces sp. NPDC005813 TaxID=3155592 RepID=UPI0033EB3B71
MAQVEFCFTCWPGGPVVPPPCLRCGSRSLYYTSGLCERCHPAAIPPPDSCRNCLAWGATRTHGWLCLGCKTWCRKYAQPAAVCRSCGHLSVLDPDQICRLCRKQTSQTPATHRPTDFDQIRRSGQQLFLADLFSSRCRGASIPTPARRRTPVVPQPPRPFTFTQLALLEATRSLKPRGSKGLAQRADPQLAAWVEQFTRKRAAQHGWSPDTTWRVRTGVNILLGFETIPGTAIAATDVDILAELRLPVALVTTVLKDAGLLHDDRIPAVIAWTEQQITHLPPAMTIEIRTWQRIMREGRTTRPRRRPRSDITIRIYLNRALPALTQWAAQGKTSLREISHDDVQAALPPTGTPRALTGRALRSLFDVLKTSRLIFTNPIRQIPTGYVDSNIPMPLSVHHIQNGLTSPDTATALLTALLAFHGLTARQVERLQLTDFDHRHLTLDDRRVLLADPVLDRLSAYLDHRHYWWPTTQNPHLFIHFRNAHTTAPVGNRWINMRLGPHLTPRKLRDDRLLSEAHAGGDTKHLMELFGLTPGVAQRYTATLKYPDLATPHPGTHPTPPPQATPRGQHLPDAPHAGEAPMADEDSQRHHNSAVPDTSPEERKRLLAAESCNGPDCQVILRAAVSRLPTARYCSARCRQAAHRFRQRHRPRTTPPTAASPDHSAMP